jgi:hypothetical protein
MGEKEFTKEKNIREQEPEEKRYRGNDNCRLKGGEREYINTPIQLSVSLCSPSSNSLSPNLGFCLGLI